jgi:hypothetical protein
VEFAYGTYTYCIQDRISEGHKNQDVEVRNVENAISRGGSMIGTPPDVNLATQIRLLGGRDVTHPTMETIKGIFHKPTPQEQVHFSMTDMLIIYSYRNGKRPFGRRNVF